MARDAALAHGMGYVATERPWQQPRFFDDLRYELLLAIRHDVDPGHARHLAHLLDDLDADTLAFGALFLFVDALKPFDNLVGNVHARHLATHELSGAY